MPSFGLHLGRRKRERVRNAGMTIETAIAETPSADSGAWTLQAFLGEIEHFGTHTALLAVKGGAVESWTFAELANCARRLAGGLLREGVGPGEPVLLMGRGSPDWVVEIGRAACRERVCQYV